MGLPGLSLDLGSTKIYLGDKAALVDILRKQGNGPNFWGDWNAEIWKTLLGQ